MGRRQKPRSAGRRADIAWPIILLGVILVVAAAVLLTRQGNDGGTAQVVVDRQQIDYGYVKFGETRAFEISITNAGDGALRFKEKPYIEVLEGC